MGVYIRGMEMPTSCQSCFANEYQTCIFADKNASVNGKLLDCPLVPVPPHGRLIDADAFLAEQRHLYCENCGRRKGMKNGKMKFVYDIGDAPCRACGYGDVLDDIDDAPTIIEAEEGET